MFAGVQVVVATGLGISGRVSGRSTDDKAEILQYPATIQGEDRIEILTGSRASAWLKLIDVGCPETKSLGPVTIVSATPSGEVTSFLPFLHVSDQTQTSIRTSCSYKCCSFQTMTTDIRRLEILGARQHRSHTHVAPLLVLSSLRSRPKKISRGKRAAAFTNNTHHL